MRIQFLKPDPRAGNIAELDPDLANSFIAEGRAKKVDENATSAVEAEPAPADDPAPAPAPAAEAEPVTTRTVAKKAAKTAKKKA